MANIFDMSNKVALVTGGSRGLGRAMCHTLAEFGAEIVVVSRDLEACEATAREIQQLGGRARAFSCHVGKWSEIDRLVDNVYREVGSVDVLINNAGIATVASSLVEASEDLFDKVVGVNFKGPFRLSALVGSKMADGKGGAIINISSIASTRPSGPTAIYGAAKSAMNTLTRAFAYEYAPKVRVNGIICGPFHTDISRSWSKSDEFRELAKTTFAMQRAADPEEIATTVLYLASDRSSFTTGTLVEVSGGRK